MNRHSMPSKSEVRRGVQGHARRAQARIGEMMKGDSPQDIFFQAMVGAVCASTAVRLLRLAPIGAIVSSIAPMAAFALFYQKLMQEKG